MTMKKQTAKAMRAIRLTMDDRHWLRNRLQRQIADSLEKARHTVIPHQTIDGHDTHPAVVQARAALETLALASMPKAFRRAFRVTPTDLVPPRLRGYEYVNVCLSPNMSWSETTFTVRMYPEGERIGTKPAFIFLPNWTERGYHATNVQLVPLSSIREAIAILENELPEFRKKAAAKALDYLTSLHAAIEAVHDEHRDALRAVEHALTDSTYSPFGSREAPKVKNVYDLYQLWPDLAKEICRYKGVEFPTDAKVEEQEKQKATGNLPARISGISAEQREAMRTVATIANLPYDSCREEVESKRSILDVKQEATVASIEAAITATQEKV